MKRSTGTTPRTLAAAIGLVLVCFTFAWAAPPEGKGGGNGGSSGGGGGGGGDSITATGVVYYYYTPDLISMDADGTNKTLVGLDIGSAIPSIAEHNDMRWFLQGYFDLYVTSADNTTVTLYTAPDDATIAAMRWISDPVGGADAYVSWYEVPVGSTDMTDGTLVRAPVIYSTDGDITGLDLTSAEYYFGTSWDYDWSPDGTFVVYRDENELWTYNTFTDEHDILPTTVSNQPRWSPDGTRIAYGASADNWTTIETVDLDALSITVVAKAKNRGVNGKFVSRPSWSPDGEFILYRHVDASGYDWYYDIMRCTHDGQSPTNLTADVTLLFHAHTLTTVGWRSE
ncbi:hypothetical protein ACFL5Q_01155 [Planctomycetota bacterium]